MASGACAPEASSYYGSVQRTYEGYAQPGYVQPDYSQPGYVTPGYADPGYVVPDAGPGFVQPYGYAAPFVPGYGYDRRREYRDPGFRDREFRREFQERGEREHRFRDDQERFNRERADRRCRLRCLWRRGAAKPGRTPCKDTPNEADRLRPG